MLMEEFENQLVDLYNKCTLPVEAKRYVVAHFASEVDYAYHKDMAAYVERERKQADKKEAESSGN